jgi:endoglucanase
MQRREFSQAAAAIAALASVGLERIGLAAVPAARTGPAAMGTNLSGMEWARPGLRYGLSTAPNIHFTVPRKADVAYLAACGFTKNRLPIQWELLQPMLHDTVANAASRSLIGEPGSFHAAYESFITGVLDAHAAAGIQCIIDLHNYARYQDFKYQADGSVIGLKAAPNPFLRPYTTDNRQVQVRLFALAPGATLKLANFVDFWRRAAARWKGHPGLGGYGLMNEPGGMPAAGQTQGVNEIPPYYGEEDWTIWPKFAQAAIDAIRSIDTATPIYVSVNEWNSPTPDTDSHGFPLAGKNLVYEPHMYLDSRSSGARFDWDVEATAGFSVMEPGHKGINVNTGFNRLTTILAWCKKHGLDKVAIGETAMPIDDPRWQQSFHNMMKLAVLNNVEVYSWMGGNHWAIHNYGINHTPGWHQNKTLEPLVSGVMKASMGKAQATLFDDGPGHAPAGTPVSITVYARGNLARPLTLTVTAVGKGKLSKSQLTIPPGPNGQDSFTWTPTEHQVATLRYSGDGQVPPPRKIFSLSDPVAYAATSLPDAAMAIIAKYSASKWDMADGYTDYMLGAPAADGQAVRAVCDSGYGSSPGNAMEMINWTNKDSSAMGGMTLPVMRVNQGRKSAEQAGGNTFGFWCKKSIPMADVQPHPKNLVPYQLDDPHFVIAAVRIAAPNSTGVVFQASVAEERHATELGLINGQPSASWVDSKGQAVELTCEDKLPPNTLSVLALTSAQGAQRLRVNSAVVGSSSATFAPSPYGQMLLGWGYLSYYPRDGFAGHIHAVITGKGVPTATELAVLEQYLGK